MDKLARASKPHLPTHVDPRRDLDELDFRDPSARRPPTGQDWSTVPVTTADLLALAARISGYSTEIATLAARVVTLEAWREADRSGELEQARACVAQLEATEKKRREDAEAATKKKLEDEAAKVLTDAVERARLRRERIEKVITLVAGWGFGLLSMWLSKKC